MTTVLSGHNTLALLCLSRIEPNTIKLICNVCQRTIDNYIMYGIADCYHREHNGSSSPTLDIVLHRWFFWFCFDKSRLNMHDHWSLNSLHTKISGKWAVNISTSLYGCQDLSADPKQEFETAEQEQSCTTIYRVRKFKKLYAE